LLGGGVVDCWVAKRLILGGAAVHRCDPWMAFNAGFIAAEEALCQHNKPVTLPVLNAGFQRSHKTVAADSNSGADRAVVKIRKAPKIAEKTSVQNPKMCKSQNRKEFCQSQPAWMLMSDELHNWLLLMVLKVKKLSSQFRPCGRFLK